MNFEEKTKNQGTSKPETSQEEKVNGDMAAELVELDDVQLATVVGGGGMMIEKKMNKSDLIDKLI